MTNKYIIFVRRHFGIEGIIILHKKSRVWDKVHDGGMTYPLKGGMHASTILCPPVPPSNENPVLLSGGVGMDIGIQTVILLW